MYLPTGFETRPGLVSFTCDHRRRAGQYMVLRNTHNSTGELDQEKGPVEGWEVKFVAFSLAAWRDERQEVLVIVEYPLRYTH
jgi:hypothetical protein